MATSNPPDRDSRDPARDTPAASAESVYADYRRRVAGGESLEFDTFCAEHARIAGALQALHSLSGSETDADLNTSPLPAGLAGSVPARDAAEPPGRLTARQIGPYRILQRLGEGGMGVVYLAEQKSPIQRRVALKVIKLGMDTRDVVARFEAERQALAMMNHPNIARVYDAGATDDGRPYFVMENVQGAPITEYCDRHKLSLRERLELFVQVCQGIDHAHHRGVIHRDIKPSNILVSTPDRQPVAKVIDFGVAKATNQRLTEKTLYTEIGRAVGTPAYMSPEQAEMSSEDVDHRTDVYALGVLLYELLVGELPLDWEALSKAAFDEVLRRIREEEPLTPSTRWSRLNLERTRELAHERNTSPAMLRSELRGDLDWIAMRAMEKERNRRYGAAAELADDIGRHLRGEAVEAGPPGATYRARKYLAKHRGPVSVAAIVLFLVTLGAIAVTSLYFRWQRESEVARTESQERRNAEYGPAVLAAVAKMQVARVAGGVGTARRVWTKGASSIIRAADLDALGGEVANSLKEALAALAEQARAVPVRPEAHYYLARGHYILRHYDAALATVESALQVDPSFVPAHDLRVRVLKGLKETGRAEIAAAALNKASGVESGWRRLWLEGMQGLERDHNKEAAKAFTELLAQRHGEREVYLGADAEVYLGRGEARLALGNVEGALQDFVAAHTLWPEAIEPLLLVVKAEYRLGRRAEADARLEAFAARRGFDAASVLGACAVSGDVKRLEWVTRLPEGYVRDRILTNVLGGLERHDEAIEVARRALQIKPDDTLSRYWLGWALLRTGKVEEAVGSFEEVVRLRANFWYAYNALGHCLKAQGHLPQAFERYCQSTPELCFPFDSSKNVLGFLEEHDDLELPGAVEHVRRAIGTVGTDLNERERDRFARLHLSLALAHLRDPQNLSTERAQEACHRAGEFATDTTRARVAMVHAQILLQTGAPVRAVLVLESALREKPKDAPLLTAYRRHVRDLYPDLPSYRSIDDEISRILQRGQLPTRRALRALELIGTDEALVALRKIARAPGALAEAARAAGLRVWERTAEVPASKTTRARRGPTRTVVSSDFDASVEREWSDRRVDEAPNGRRFLGQFGNDTVRLTLKNLPPHQLVEVRFDFLAIRSWDGDQVFNGPDVWSVRIEGGPELYRTSFATYARSFKQSYPDGFLGGDHLALTGATEENMGYRFQDRPMGAVYPTRAVFPHRSGSLVLTFSAASQLQMLEDESWGLDNVEVTLDPAVPPLDANALVRLCDTLASNEAVKASDALWTLVSHGDAAVDALQERLVVWTQPLPRDRQEQLRQRFEEFRKAAGAENAPARIAYFDARLHQLRGEYDTATEKFRGAVKLDAARFEPRLRLVECLAARGGDLEAARRVANEAVAHGATEAEAASALGEVAGEPTRGE